MDELIDPATGVTDVEIIRRLRSLGVGANPAFDKLAKLIGSDLKALKALREETKFVRAHPELPVGSAFADVIRGYLLANKLEWTQENLEKAVAVYRAQDVLASSCAS